MLPYCIVVEDKKQLFIYLHQQALLSVPYQRNPFNILSSAIKKQTAGKVRPAVVMILFKLH